MKMSNEESRNAGIPLARFLVSFFPISICMKKTLSVFSASSVVKNIFAA